jgi:hypothetical protein
MVHLLPARFPLAALTALGLVAAASPARALTVLEVTLPELVRTSEVVLWGEITDLRTLDLRPQGRAIFTEYRLAVREVWKGDPRAVGRTFTWRALGGSGSDGLTMAVPGMPGFARGEEVVVLLERTSEGHVLCGAGQGKFIVHTDKSGKKTVTRNLTGAQLLRRDPRTGRLVPAQHPGALVPPPGASRSLADLRAEILATVKAQASERPQAAVLAAPVPRKLARPSRLRPGQPR